MNEMSRTCAVMIRALPGNLQVRDAGPAEADLARRAVDAVAAALRRVGHGGLQDEAGGAVDAAGGGRGARIGTRSDTEVNRTTR